jgi:hypothetical protein
MRMARLASTRLFPGGTEVVRGRTLGRAHALEGAMGMGMQARSLVGRG